VRSTLQRGQILDELAQHLYGFLPGKAHPYGQQALSFPAVAEELGVGMHWPGGSKQPAIRRLLEGVLDSGSGRFSPLIVKIVERAITYRRRSNPITRDEIDALNGFLRQLGYQVPELHDPIFLAGLPRAVAQPAEPPLPRPTAAILAALQNRLMQIASEGAQQRGYTFETFLNELFHVHGLAPRGAFRLQGEQIDGSFNAHQVTYLLEAKWTATTTGQADLLAFAGKVEGKAQWTRGLFVSYSGFSEDGLQAFARGKPTRILCMDGLDLAQVLSGALDLVDVIERKARRASETNNAFVPVRELFPSVI